MTETGSKVSGKRFNQSQASLRACWVSAALVLTEVKHSHLCCYKVKARQGDRSHTVVGVEGRSWAQTRQPGPCPQQGHPRLTVNVRILLTALLPHRHSGRSSCMSHLLMKASRLKSPLPSTPDRLIREAVSLGITPGTLPTFQWWSWAILKEAAKASALRTKSEPSASTVTKHPMCSCAPSSLRTDGMSKPQLWAWILISI